MTHGHAENRNERTGTIMKRRGLIAGAAALVAGIAAQRASQPVAATSGTGPDGPLVLGSNYANSINTESRITLVGAGATWGGISPGLFGADATAGAAPTNTTALYGVGKGTGAGILATTNQQPGASGFVGLNAAVFGLGSAGKNGVHGTSSGANGHGVQGIIEAGQTASGTIGVYGANLSSAANSHGIVGLASNGHGLVGTASNSNPVYAGLVGQGSGGAGAGNFFGNVAVTGNLFVGGNQTVAGAKSAALAHPDGSHRLVYCVEAPESWLEDFGKGTLANGAAQIKVDADFAAVADMSDYHVFLTAYGVDGNGLSVASQSATGFIVQERNKGTSTTRFSWRVVAKRKDIKAARLAKFDVPKMQPPAIPLPPAAPAATPGVKGADTHPGGGSP
jgi:hypothetical protein